MCPSLPHMLKQMPTAQTTPGPHLTWSMMKNNTGWNKLETTDIMDIPEHSSIS